MINLLVLLTVLSAGAPAIQGADATAGANGLPDLNIVRSAKLAPSYSCRSKAEFAAGYEATALWLSAYSRRRNAPDLLFDGACGGENYFVASTAGDDMALIGDLGPNVSLPTVTFARAFNYRQVAGPGSETRFATTAPIVAGHTYVVVLDKADIRGLFALTVTRYDPDASVEFTYVVLTYAVSATVDRAR